MQVAVHIIEPCGFPFSKRALRRYAMDYADLVTLHHHQDWETFEARRKDTAQRLILLTTKADTAYSAFKFRPDDILMVGSESSGAPDLVHSTADAQITIPMSAHVRSLNVAVSAAMVLGEALRQTDGWPLIDQQNTEQ
jgi:tRNA (cytidine/uridine-2'-O-)-methyltransferase